MVFFLRILYYSQGVSDVHRIIFSNNVGWSKLCTYSIPKSLQFGAGPEEMLYTIWFLSAEGAV